MAKASTYGPMDQSTSGNSRMAVRGMESSTTPMEQLKEPFQTVDGFPNNQLDIAEKTERFMEELGKP